MVKQEISELRKALKQELLVPDRVFQCYVSNENQVLWENEDSFLTVTEEQQNRMTEIIKEIINPALGVKTHCVEVRSNKTLLDMLSTPGQCEKEWDSVKETLLTSYIHTDPCYLLMIEFHYDVPGKYSDGTYGDDDSSETYSGFVAAVCPAKLSSAEMGYENAVRELERRWVIQKPLLGFLYPSFRDRTEDVSEVVFYSKSPKHEAFLHSLFSVQEFDIPDSDEEYRDKFSSLVAGVETDIEESAALRESILELSGENPDDVLNKTQIRNLFENVSDADMSSFDRLYDEVMREDIPVSSLAQKQLVIKTDTCEIKCAMDHAEMIREETIDGAPYICVPADGDVFVNGALTVRKRGKNA